MSALGASGAGFTDKFGEQELTFSPWTQLMMDAFESWLVLRLRGEAMDVAEMFRRKARKLYREAVRLQERGMALAGTKPTAEQKRKAQEEYEDIAGEAQSLEFEAREMVNKISEQKAAGYYHFFGALAREARGQFNGRVKIAHLSLLPKQPNITLAEVEAVAIKHWKQLDDAMTEAQDESKNAPAPAVSTPPSPTATSASPSTSESAAAATASSTP